MEFRILACLVLYIGCVHTQTFKVCVKSMDDGTCQSLEQGGSQTECNRVRTNIDCAVKLSRGEVDIGYFNEEEILLLAQQVSNENRVVATVRDQSRIAEPYAFEAVAVVPNTHTNGLEGLRNGNYFHPGFGQSDLRWSPRVLKALEVAAAQTDRVPSDVDMTSRTADHVEVEALNSFFAAACRPGAWSSNSTVDAQLKNDFPQLCNLCGGPCDAGYNIDLGVTVAGVRNDNRHIQAIEALKRSSTGTNNTPGVAYVAWLHVVQYFNIRNPADAASFSLLCPNGTLVALNSGVLGNAISPCAFVRQPWGAIVANANSAQAVLTSIQTWWTNGQNPGGNTWQSVAFSALAAGGGSNARVVFQDTPLAVANYTDPIRTITPVDASSPALRAQRWCTTSAQEQAKCSWTRAAAHSLGISPPIACQQKTTIFECLTDIRDGIADLIASPSNYGYIARQHFKLSPVKMVQNQRAAAARIAAFVKETSAQTNVTRFENLKGAKACFPEYGGLAYVAFVRAGQERGVLSSSECDYARAVGEFFSGACAPGAFDSQHSLSVTNFDTNVLCSACRPAPLPGVNTSDFTCAWNFTNQYYGNNGSLACLNDPDTDVAILNMQNINTDLTALNLTATNFRALCRNNSLAIQSGVNNLDDNCLLAHVVDAEVVTRRNDQFYNSLNVLLDSLEVHFGYIPAGGPSQLINLELFSPFDGNSDLLFKDSTIGLTEPSITSTHEPAKNYIELFEHLNACTGAAPISGGFYPRSVYSIISMIVVALALM